MNSVYINAVKANKFGMKFKFGNVDETKIKWVITKGYRLRLLQIVRHRGVKNGLELDTREWLGR
jgi:hypothetical protein